MKKKIALIGLLAFASASVFAQPAAVVINAQTGTTYTVLNTDCGKLVTFSNSSSIAVTLPQAGASGNFANGCVLQFANLGTGNATVTPTTSTIGGRSSFVMQASGGWLSTVSDGANYQPRGFQPALGTTGLVDQDQLPTASPAGASNIKGAIVPGTTFTMSGTGNKTLNVSDNGRTAAIAVPVCPAGVGCPTTGAPDIYPIPFTGAIAANFTPVVLCRVSPAASTTVVVKKWTAGNPATSSTICTTTLSTACSMTACTSSAATIASGNGISVEATQASADASAVITVTVPILKD
jgi:hypothetical protein